MKNKFFICTLLLIFSIDLFSQKFISRNSQVNFNASTILEEIQAINNNVSCILDSENGNVAIQMKMISFKFKKALMEEHFNEKYVESEKYPNSNFVGDVDMYSGASSAHLNVGRNNQERLMIDVNDTNIK